MRDWYEVTKQCMTKKQLWGEENKCSTLQVAGALKGVSRCLSP